MKLLSIKVEHFRCIRAAKIDFAGGLNVLYGPNDLGKSSLAHAIRAALLLQTSAREHGAFVSWHDAAEPFVELVFESEPQRIWRVRKTFGGNSASLEHSRDGVDFSPEVRGRQVDERLSEILRWGLARPGGKGRPKGMPMTFLSTALLAEQDRVSAIFDQALADDSDESGKKQLVSALQAMAEDPMFKNVLTRVQERVDQAFNVSDEKVTRKRGRNSPWVKLNEEINRRLERSIACEQELQKTTAIEIEIQQLRDRRLEMKDSADQAREWIETLQADFAKSQRRQEIQSRLDECQARLGAIAGELQQLSEAERAHAEDVRAIATLSKKRDDAQTACAGAATRAQQAKDELARLQGEDGVRRRQLEQSELETRRADLRAQQLRQQSALAGIRAVEATEAKVAALDKELGSLSGAAAALQKQRDAAEKARGEVETEERELRAIRSLFRRQTAHDELQQAGKGAAQLDTWRKEAAAKHAAADALESDRPRFALPSSAQLDSLRRLESDMRVASAKLDVGLSVTVRPKRPLHITVRRDGESAASLDLMNTALEATARRKLQFEIDGVAEIAISGGPADARQEVDRLEEQWSKEGAPLLRDAGVATVEALARQVQEIAQRSAAIDAARRETAQLEQRIADQPDWASLLTDRQQQLDAAEKALAGADRSKLEKAARKLKIADVAAVEKRLDALRVKLDTLAKDEKRQDSDLAAANTRVTEKQKALADARADRDRAQSSVEGDWQKALRQVLDQQAQAQKQLDAVEADLQRLASAGDESVAAAQKVLAASQQKFSGAAAAVREAQQALTDATLRHATNEGILKTRRESAARLDQQGAREALQQVETEMSQAPVPAHAVTPELLAQAQSALDGASARLEELDGEIREKRGALHQVGGEVARQRAADAATELESARERERLVELDYNAWELLRKTLREAEQEEGTHLGHALAEPVAKRFAALTTGRYGKLALGPNLETEGISVAGENRLVHLLSVGTRDQLSTVFRLTLAEQLKTAVMLDDQLTQSDTSRMQWVRDLLQEVSANIQVIVFTCRPEDYLIAPTGGRGKSKRGEDPASVRAVDLTQFIERSVG